MRRVFPWASLLVLMGGLAMGLGAGTTFTGLDLGPTGDLLFVAETEAPTVGTYRAGYLLRLAETPDKPSGLQPYTFFPEQARYLPDTQQVQIENRFGVFRSTLPFRQVEALQGFPSFASGQEIPSGLVSWTSPSPDGQWVVFQRPLSPAWVELVLRNLATGTEQTLSSRTDFRVDGPGVVWAADSSLLIYEKEQSLYYFSPSQARTGRVLGENFRHIGLGRMESIQLTPRKDIYLVQGSLVYRIAAAELFTRALYQDFLPTGTVVGRLPHDFDPDFDDFSLSPDGRILLFAKNRQTYYFYPMNEDQHPQGLAWRLPFLRVPRAATFTQVLWGANGLVSLLFESRDAQGTRRTLVYQLDAATAEPTLDLVEFPLVHKAVATSEGIVALGTDKVYLVDPKGWKILQEYTHDQPRFVFEPSPRRLLVLGARYSEWINLDEKSRDFLFFSQADQLGYDAVSSLVSIRSGDRSASMNEGRWIPRSGISFRPAQTANTRVRVGTEPIHSGPYRNTLVVRQVQSVGTDLPIPPPKTTWAPFPRTDEAYDPAYVRHGSRIRSRSVALTFNAVDGIEGLEEVLATLRAFDIQATFFVNGDFLRAYPAAVSKIVFQGHEVANLFFTWFDFTDARYRIDTDFIKLGLARNEDEFRDLTGQELSLLWRSPYNLVNSLVLDASRTLRYTLVGSDVDGLVFEAMKDSSGRWLLPGAAEVVERILVEKQPGSIITLGLGRRISPPGEAPRQGYGFQKLDVLVHHLLQEGYEMVTVSRLVEAARQGQ